MRITVYSLWILIIVYFLTGCASSAVWKSALGSTAGSVVVSSAEQSDDVVVLDLTEKQPKKTIVKPTQPNNVLDWETSTDIPVIDETQPNTPEPSQAELNIINDREEDDTLMWFFFSMMLMGMIGASIIGIIEAIQTKKTNKELETKPSKRTRKAK